MKVLIHFKSKNENILSIYLINIRGINKHKIAELMDVVKSDTCVLCITESHEKYQKVDLPDGYDKLVRRREDGDKKGGGLMMIHGKLNIKAIEYNTRCSDLLHCKLNCGELQFELILIYMDVADQNRNDIIRAEILEILQNIEEDEKIMILGDFNGHLGFIGNQELNRNGKFVIEIMENYNLVLLNGDDLCIGETTREENGHKSSIDFVLVNDQLYNSFSTMLIDENKELFDISDHCLLKVDLVSKKNKQGNIKTERIDYFSVKDSLRDEFVQKVEDLIMEQGIVQTMDSFDRIMEESAESVTKRMLIKRYHKQEPEPHWFTKEMKDNIRQRKFYSKKWRTATDIDRKKEYELEYKKQKRKVQELVREGITSSEKKLTRDIREGKNGKMLWKTINKLRNFETKNPECKLYDDNGSIIESYNIKEAILDYWQNIYQKHSNSMNEKWHVIEKNRYIARYGNDELVLRGQAHDSVGGFMEFLWRVARGERSQMSNEDLERYRASRVMSRSEASIVENERMEWMQQMEFSTVEVKKQLGQLKDGKKGGPNGLKNEMYKWLMKSEICVNTLTDCYNNVKQIGPPVEWKMSKTVLIPKKKKPMIKDLRPIALTDTSYKVYMSLCKEKLIDHLSTNYQFSTYQNGFTRGRRLEDNLFILSFCINESRMLKKPLYVCAIDFEKAFDSIRRSCIVEALIKYRCDPLLIDVICQLYDHDQTSIYFNNKEIGNMEISSGIRQGCTGSPLIFIMVVNHIIESIIESKIGFRSGDISVPCLFFADDGLLLTQSEGQMRRLLQCMEKASAEVGLKVNKNKSNLLLYGMESVCQQIEGIEVTTCIRYLGVNISTSKDFFLQQKENKIKEAKKLSNMTYSVISRACNKLLIGKTYWEMVAMPSLLFASSVITWNKTELDKMQRSENEVWRKILGAPGYAPLVAMRGDIGAATVISKDAKSKLKYIKHIYTSENKLLNDILNAVIGRRHPYGRKVLQYLNIINIDQVSDLRERSEGDIARSVDSWVLNEWKEELNSKSTLSIYKSCKNKMKEEKFYDNTLESVLLFKARANCLKLEWRSRFWGGDTVCKTCQA